MKNKTIKTQPIQKLISFVLPSPLPGHGGWGNGYVALPPGHPCYGLDYDTIHDRYDINVNGGLTYSEPYDVTRDPAECIGMWIVGFDTMHAWDSISNWPKGAVLLEALRLQSQFENIKNAL